MVIIVSNLGGYQNIVVDAHKAGGPDKWLEIIKKSSYKAGAADMKNSLIVPLLGLGIGIGVVGVLATQKIINWIRENKEQKVISEVEAKQAEKYLLEELEKSIAECEVSTISEKKDIDGVNDPRVLRGVIQEYIAKLSVEERVVMRRRYGLDGEDPRSVEEVAKELLMTVEEVEKIETEALRKLRE